LAVDGHAILGKRGYGSLRAEVECASDPRKPST
jgi:hypothetical protein